MIIKIINNLLSNKLLLLILLFIAVILLLPSATLTIGASIWLYLGIIIVLYILYKMFIKR